MKQWYQNAIIDGVEMPCYRKADTADSRWEQLIAPFVSTEGAGRIFLDLGCNAGYNMRRARELGYRTIGIDNDEDFLAQARFWEERDPKGVEIIRGDIANYSFRSSYIALMSCVHHYIPRRQLKTILHRLHRSTVYLIIVGRPSGRTRSIYPPDQKYLLPLLSRWKIVDERHTKRHYSILARSLPMCEVETEDLWSKTQEIVTKSVHKDVNIFYPAFQDFTRKVLSGKAFYSHKTPYYAYMFHRGFSYKDALIEWFTRLILSIREDGMHTPMILSSDGQIMDGHHRLIVAHELNIPKLICRKRSHD